MFFNFSLFKTSGDQILEQYQIGLSVGAHSNFGLICYSLASNEADLDTFVKAMSPKGKVKYAEFKAHGDPAVIVFNLIGQDDSISYSKTATELFFESGINNLSQIDQFSSSSMLNFVYFDIQRNTWGAGRVISQKLDYMCDLAVPKLTQQALF